MTTSFCVLFICFYVGHLIGDYWVQTGAQACGKDAATRTGRRLCMTHVATLTWTKVLVLSLVGLAVDVRLSFWAVAAGMAVDAISHYVADRRRPLAALAGALDSIGKAEFYRMGQPRPGTADRPHLGTGAHALDQSWHTAFLLVAALIASLGGSAS